MSYCPCLIEIMPENYKGDLGCRGIGNAPVGEYDNTVNPKRRTIKRGYKCSGDWRQCEHYKFAVKIGLVNNL